MDNLPIKAKAGRPLGAKSSETLQKDAMLKAFKEKGMKAMNVLFNSQLHLARGQTFLYKIEKEVIIGVKGGKSIRLKPPRLVTSQDEIEEYLTREVDISNGAFEVLGPEDTYYFITAKEPSIQASESILDRTFGKAIQTTQTLGPGGESLFEDEHRIKAKTVIGEYLESNIGEGGQTGDQSPLRIQQDNNREGDIVQV